MYLQVAGIVGRADLLCALFFLLSFLFYHKAAIADGSTVRSRGEGVKVLPVRCHSNYCGKGFGMFGLLVIPQAKPSMTP